MTFFTDILVSILSGYLAFTNGIAGYLLEQFPDLQSPHALVAEEVKETETMTTSGLSEIKSKYEYGGPIPNILIEKSTYQQPALAVDSLKKSSSSSTTNNNVNDALVNIFCTYRAPKYARTTTGTGFIIDPRGVILTNAHVAQFLLLEEVEGVGTTTCEIKTGDPAVSRYKARLLYISPRWVEKQAFQIGEMEPKGTGERDYAILYIYADIEDQAVTKALPHLALSTDALSKSQEGEAVLIAGYPAENLSRADVEYALAPKSATSTILELYTYGTDMADVIVVDKNPIGLKGSSGGPVLDTKGNAIGLIVTQGNPDTEGIGSLRALTLSYINRTIEEDTGFTLKENLTGNLNFRAELFKNNLLPFLSSWLQEELE